MRTGRPGHGPPANPGACLRPTARPHLARRPAAGPGPARHPGPLPRTAPRPGGGKQSTACPPLHRGEGHASACEFEIFHPIRIIISTCFRRLRHAGGANGSNPGPEVRRRPEAPGRAGRPVRRRRPPVPVPPVRPRLHRRRQRPHPGPAARQARPGSPRHRRDLRLTHPRPTRPRDPAAQSRPARPDLSAHCDLRKYAPRTRPVPRRACPRLHGPTAPGIRNDHSPIPGGLLKPGS